MLSGFNMLVYNAKEGQFSHKFFSKHLSTADNILLSNNLRYMITVELDHVSIWRLEPISGINGYEKYMNDNCTNDDEQDTGESYYDDFDDEKRQDIIQKTVIDLLYTFI